MRGQEPFYIALDNEAGNRDLEFDMALPKALQPSLTPDELTFLAEEDVIDIVPLFSMTRVRLLSVIFTCLSSVRKLTTRGSTVLSNLPPLVVCLYGWHYR